MNKTEEHKYQFKERVGATGKKFRIVTVKESQLTVEHKEFMYNQFMDSYANLPEDLKDRFFHNFLVNITKQAEVLKAKKEGSMVNKEKPELTIEQPKIIKTIQELEEDQFIKNLTKRK